MSEGMTWVDRVMAPLGWSGRHIPAAEYNRIYEAVARGTEAQGQGLVAAILNLIALDRAVRAGTPEKENG